MSIFKKKTHIYTRTELHNLFSYASNPSLKYINEKIDTYYIGFMPIASFIVDWEVIPKDTKCWRSKFDYGR